MPCARSSAAVRNSFILSLLQLSCYFVFQKLSGGRIVFFSNVFSTSAVSRCDNIVQCLVHICKLRVICDTRVFKSNTFNPNSITPCELQIKVIDLSLAREMCSTCCLVKDIFQTWYNGLCHCVRVSRKHLLGANTDKSEPSASHEHTQRASDPEITPTTVEMVRSDTETKKRYVRKGFLLFFVW